METPMVDRWIYTDQLAYHPTGRIGGSRRIADVIPEEKAKPLGLCEQMLAMRESGMTNRQIGEYFGYAPKSRKVEWCLAYAKQRRLRDGLS